MEKILSQLTNENSLIRNAALLELIDRKAPYAIPYILEALHDVDIGVRSTAAFALSKLGNVDCVPSLEACLRESINVDAHLCRQLIVALTDICEGDRVDSIAIGMESSLPSVRSTTAEFLSHVDHKRTEKLLRKYAFTETDPDVLRVIQEALSEISQRTGE